MLKDLIIPMFENAFESARAAGDLTSEDKPAVVIETPPNEAFGDFSCNIAMTLARAERKAPLVIAEKIVKHFEAPEGFLRDARIEKPGFINLYLDGDFLCAKLGEIFSSPDDFGKNESGAGKSVHLEFVSANPTGPLHVGHGRGAALGDVLGRVLEASDFRVHREYYINDAGNQIETLAKSACARYLQDVKGDAVPFPGDGYQGEYIREIVKSSRFREGIGALEDEQALLSQAGVIAKDLILEDIKKSLSEFRVRFDEWFSESSLFTENGNKIEEAIAALEATGKLYEKDGAKWLASSAYGDEKDRVVVRDDGRPTYLASDIAYHHLKYERGFDRYINIWGADHHGYLPRVRASMGMLGHDPDKLDVLFVQFVSLRRGGEAVQMSTRAGEFEELSAVVDEVGVDAARFFFLMRSADTALEFDLDLAKEQSSENPVYYVQYAHARACSLFRQAAEEGESFDDLDEPPPGVLVLAEERQLMKNLLEWPDVVRTAAERLEPHHITFGLIALAKQFHAYYNRNRILGQGDGLTRARLCLAKCVQIVLKNGLNLLGVSAPEKM
ncbi:MAG: arginine--tRNA ligase [Nitrospinae bacterium]|nr:arginine--tRNA ligase [Nitrospinota bacterium]